MRNFWGGVVSGSVMTSLLWVLLLGFVIWLGDPDPGGPILWGELPR